MRYAVRHVTTYRYGSSVTFAHCTLTLTPRSGQGQVVEDTALTITPRPVAMVRHWSFFGHEVATVQIDTPHRELRIEAASRIKVDRCPVESEVIGSIKENWTETAQAARAMQSLEAEAPSHFLFASALVPLADPVTTYVRESLAPGRSAFEAAAEIMRRIYTDFRYAPEATQVSTPLLEAFERRHGVCQDYAHIMIAGLRGVGLAARYVSGYIRTIPPEGQQRLEGADATHAWIDVWCGSELGWVGFDPTNAILAGNDHIVLATGRDYADVAPVGGVLLGTSNQDIVVNVDVVPLPDETDPEAEPAEPAVNEEV
ncbi:transglutaminase family protein [Lichenifustis flavocetrariae]|uniref:Transglutaminase family protein n=1 Tax=Lichenifustis flavocetrariae TaxID=2949735 RepID=A0AA41Z143_9HYPH|nr:transglutaminase family protein [Lichenifustis flavocetrariae]MCW6508485.1 transglutaminase family protein [Lichenifustis flavocetrariae]